MYQDVKPSSKMLHSTQTRWKLIKANKALHLNVIKVILKKGKKGQFDSSFVSEWLICFNWQILYGETLAGAEALGSFATGPFTYYLSYRRCAMYNTGPKSWSHGR